MLIYQGHKLSVAELAKALGYTENYIRILARGGKIPCVRRNSWQYFFNLDEVLAVLEKRPAGFTESLVVEDTLIDIEDFRI